MTTEFLKLNPKLIKQWLKHGPLDVKKLIKDGFLKLQKKRNSFSLVPMVEEYCNKDTEMGKSISWGQTNANKQNGGVARVIFRDSILEGQFLPNGQLHGWARCIWSCGIYQYGWFCEHEIHGYGKIFQNGYASEGLFEKGCFIERGNEVTYDKDSKEAQEFNMEDYIVKQ